MIPLRSMDCCPAPRSSFCYRFNCRGLRSRFKRKTELLTKRTKVDIKSEEKTLKTLGKVRSVMEKEVDKARVEPRPATHSV